MAVGVGVAWAKANRSGIGAATLVRFYAQFDAIEKNIAHIVVIWCCLRDLAGS